MAKDVNQLIELLEGKDTIKQVIEKEISKETQQLMILEKATNKQTLRAALLNSFIKQGFCCVYVTFNEPAETLIAYLSKEGINLNKVVFVDGITKQAGGGKEQKGVLYLDSPKDLIELKMGIEKGVERGKERKMAVIIDSVNTLLVYNLKKSVEKFMHTIVEKNRLSKASTVLIATPHTEKDVLEQLLEFCDKQIII